MLEKDSANDGPPAHAREFRFVCHVADFEATADFYREGLGLAVVGGWDRGPDDRGLLFRAASGLIEILRTHDHQPPPAGAWLLIEVPHITELYERVTAAGLPLKEKLIDTPWGHRRFVVIDPNGVNLAFFSYIGQREA